MLRERPSSFSTAEDIMNTVSGLFSARVVLTAHELGVFEVLDRGPQNPAKVAMAIGSDPRATDRLLNALVALGLLEKNDGLLTNGPLASMHLVPEKPGFLAGLSHTAHLWESWSTLTQAVKTGKCMERPAVNDAGSAWLSSFIAAMHWRAVRQAPRVVPLVDVPENGRVLDVGGGSGAYSAEFARRGKNVRATVFDLPNVLPLTRSYLEREGVSHLVDTVPGDYLEDDFPTGFDVVFLSAIIHSNPPESNLLLFERSASALVPGGVLVVQDFIMEPGRTAPIFGAFFALNMLVGTEGGDTFTEDEVAEWMREAGLDPGALSDTGVGTGLMIGKKPAE